MRSPVQLYIRVRRPDGSYPYLRAAFTKTGRLLPHQAVSGGRIISAEEGSYYLRTRNGAKRVWEPVGSEPSVALVRLQQTIAKIQNQDSGQDDAADDPTPSPDKERPSLLLNDAIAEYLQETADHKSKKTLAAYTVALRMLSPSYVESELAALAQEKPPTEGRARRQATLLGLFKKAQVAKWSLSNRPLAEITRKDLLAYCAFLSKTHLLSPRTVRNRVDFVQIFLHHFGVGSLLKGKDLPVYTRKKVRAYNGDQIGRMNDIATQDERDLLQFFLCTGVREQQLITIDLYWRVIPGLVALIALAIMTYQLGGSTGKASSSR